MAATVFKRSNGSYYVRLFSADQELWLSLCTKDYTLAKLRAAVLHGHLALATLLSAGGSMLTREHMKRIGNSYGTRLSGVKRIGQTVRGSPREIAQLYNEREATYYV
jgi:hypothetical protein